MIAICALFCVQLCSCSSSSSAEGIQAVELQSDGVVTLSDVLAHPQLYIDTDIELEGIVQSARLRKVNKDISLMMIKLSPAEDLLQVQGPDPREKYLFINKLRQAEEAFAHSHQKEILIRREQVEEMKRLACELKIVASELEAMGHYFKGRGQSGVAAAIGKVSRGFSTLGDSYFAFEQASLSGSPEDEKMLSREDSKNTMDFERSLKSGAALLLEFSLELRRARDIIEGGLYSFEHKKVLRPQNSFEILTHASILSARSWERHREGDLSKEKSLKSVAKAMKLLGNGGLEINDGLKDLSIILNKTAVKGAYIKGPGLKCAYYGFNGSHLLRCIQKMNSVKRQVVIKISGRLMRSNLREEVNVLWLQAVDFEVDGLKMAFSYGDENGALKNAMNLYDWAESVKKGAD